MSQLEILIPENWPMASQDPSEKTAAMIVSWLTRGTQGQILRAGQSALSAMPASDACRIVLPASRVLLSKVKPPAQNRRKFMQALPYAVEDRIMADPESIHVAKGEEQENGEIPVAIVDRAWLRQIIENLNSSGFKPMRADVETLLPATTPGTWEVVWRGQGGFVHQGANQGLPLDGGDTEHPPAVLQLAIENAESKPASLRIHVDGATAPNLDAWSSALGVPVTLSGEWQRPQPTHGINLLQGEFTARNVRADWLPRLRPAIILAGLIASVHIAFTVTDWAMLKYEKYRLNTAMEQHFRKAFPEAKVIVDAPLQMRRNLVQLRHSAGVSDPNDFLPLLSQVSREMGAGTRIRNMDYQNGTLTIHAIFPGMQQIETFRRRQPQVQVQPGNNVPNGIEVQLKAGA